MNIRVRFWQVVAVCLPLLAWLISAVIIPAIQHWADWDALQIVWERWQGINVGFLAVIASFIALIATQYRARVDGERRFQASLAFLPEQLSAINDYIEHSVAALCAAHEEIPAGKSIAAGKFTLETPSLPSDYREVFSECLQHGDSKFIKLVSAFLHKIQIHHSRMSQLHRRSPGSSNLIIMRANITNYMAHLAILYGRMTYLFQFSRAGSFPDEHPTWLECYTGICMIEPDVELIEGLAEQIQQLATNEFG